MIVHLNGWPGVGKLTVGRKLAPMLNARLLDNHTLHNVALAICDFDSPERWSV
jgi:shikimate kinase